MKKYFKAIISGFIIFLFSFITPNDILEMIKAHKEWRREEDKKNTIKMYGGK